MCGAEHFRRHYIADSGKSDEQILSFLFQIVNWSILFLVTKCILVIKYLECMVLFNALLSQHETSWRWGEIQTGELDI